MKPWKSWDEKGIAVYRVDYPWIILVAILISGSYE